MKRLRGRVASTWVIIAILLVSAVNAQTLVHNPVAESDVYERGEKIQLYSPEQDLDFQYIFGIRGSILVDEGVNIVWIFDKSGSMGDDMDQVALQIGAFTTELESMGITNYNLAYGWYVNSQYYYSPLYSPAQVSTFRNGILSLNPTGGYEDGLTALDNAVTANGGIYTSDPERKVVFILVTDEDSDDLPNWYEDFFADPCAEWSALPEGLPPKLLETTELMNAYDITVYTVTKYPNGAGGHNTWEYGANQDWECTIDAATGGERMDITQDWGSTLPALASDIARRTTMGGASDGSLAYASGGGSEVGDGAYHLMSTFSVEDIVQQELGLDISTVDFEVDCSDYSTIGRHCIEEVYLRVLSGETAYGNPEDIVQMKFDADAAGEGPDVSPVPVDGTPPPAWFQYVYARANLDFDTSLSHTRKDSVPAVDFYYSMYIVADGVPHTPDNAVGDTYFTYEDGPTAEISMPGGAPVYNFEMDDKWNADQGWSTINIPPDAYEIIAEDTDATGAPLSGQQGSYLFALTQGPCTPPLIEDIHDIQDDGGQSLYIGEPILVPQGETYTVILPVTDDDCPPSSLTVNMVWAWRSCVDTCIAGGGSRDPCVHGPCANLFDSISTEVIGPQLIVTADLTLPEEGVEPHVGDEISFGINVEDCGPTKSPDGAPIPVCTDFDDFISGFTSCNVCQVDTSYCIGGTGSCNSRNLHPDCILISDQTVCDNAMMTAQSWECGDYPTHFKTCSWQATECLPDSTPAGCCSSCGNQQIDIAEQCDFVTGTPIYGGVGQPTCEDFGLVGGAGPIDCWNQGTEFECMIDTSGCTW